MSDAKAGPRIITTIRATGGEKLYKAGSEDALALDYPRRELRRLQSLGAIEGFVTDEEPDDEPETTADDESADTVAHRTRREIRSRAAELQAQLDALRELLKAERHERTAAIANGTADAVRRVPELDDSIEAREVEEKGLLSALEYLNARDREALESIRLADLTAAQEQLRATAARRAELLRSAEETAGKAADDLATIDASLTASAERLRQLGVRIGELGGEAGSPSEYAAHPRTDKLRQAIAAAKEYAARE